MNQKEFKVQAFLAVLSSTPVPSPDYVPYGDSNILETHVNRCMTTAFIATKKAKDNNLLDEESDG